MNKSVKKSLFVIILFSLFIDNTIFAQTSGTGMFINKSPLNYGNKYENSEIQPVINWLPVFAKKLHNNGIITEYPFGAGISAFYYSQKFIASSLILTSVSPITGDTIHAWADTLIQDTRAGETQLVIKPNVWLLPFLNIYGIIGYTNGTVNPNLTAPKIVVDFPGLGEQTVDTTVEIHDKLPYHGPVYGIGATFAMGIDKFFFLADYHYSKIYPNDLEGSLVYQSFSPKAGVIIDISKTAQVNVWAGAMYFSNKQTMHGKVKVSDFSEGLAQIIGDDADYEGEIVPVNNWNFLLGAGLEINKHHRIMLEGGFVHRVQLTAGYEFRF
jgi:hypothetical protein